MANLCKQCRPRSDATFAASAQFTIGLDKGGYLVNIFSYFSTKTYVVGTLCFHGEIRKISILFD